MAPSHSIRSAPAAGGQHALSLPAPAAAPASANVGDLHTLQRTISHDPQNVEALTVFEDPLHDLDLDRLDRDLDDLLAGDCTEALAARQKRQKDALASAKNALANTVEDAGDENREPTQVTMPKTKGKAAQKRKQDGSLPVKKASIPTRPPLEPTVTKGCPQPGQKSSSGRAVKVPRIADLS